MMDGQQLHSENGFTLIEALVAMAILTIGILSLYSMQINSVQGNTKANRQTVKSSLVTDQIEQLLGKPYCHEDLRDDDDGKAPAAASQWSVSSCTSNGDGTGKDPDGDGIDASGNNFGLDDMTVSTADGTWNSPDGLYAIYWNIAKDIPMPGLKTIRVHVVDKKRAGSIPITYQYIKARVN